MAYIRKALRILALACVADNAFPALGSDHPAPTPVATVDTAESLPDLRDLRFTTVAFSSETTIEVVACTTPVRNASCPASVFRWENGVLKHALETPKFITGAADSADGKRVLLDFNDRKVSKSEHFFDDMRAGWTFGMIYPEEVNREVVKVVDTTTRKSCFDWHQTFPMTLARRKSAAISPSGEFVALKVENSLSVYHLPSACRGTKVSHRADNRQ